jgi:hypothetical protein
MNTERFRQSNRRLPRFSLFTLLVGLCVFGLVMAFLGNVLRHIQHQHGVMARVEALGGMLISDYPGSDAIHRTETTWTKLVLGDAPLSRAKKVSFGRNRVLQNTDLRVLLELPALQALEIADGSQLTDRGLEPLAHLPGLRYFSVENSRITTAGLSKLSVVHSLEVLALSGPTVNDAALTQIDQLQNLKRLFLAESPHITDESLTPVAQLRELESLFLYDTAITDAGLAQLRHLPQLKYLNMSGTSVSDAGMHHLRELTKLRTLMLDRTNVTDAGLDDLAALESLESLELVGTAITDDGLPSLRAMTKLKRLCLGPGVTRQAAAELKQVLPQCKISHQDGKGVEVFR